MKKAIALIFMLALIPGLVACKQNGTNDIDSFDQSENSSEAEGIALGTQSAALCLEANSDDVRQTEEYLITNTTQIVVSAENMEQSAEVELLLYSRESTTDPIGYATLSKSSAMAIFSNLTSATSYKVAGKISNGTASITLTITDCVEIAIPPHHENPLLPMLPVLTR